MGEDEQRIKIIGSPDIDIIKHKKLGSIEDIKKKLGILYDSYAILLFHPVVTEVKNLQSQVKEIIQACKVSDKQYVVIYPNNDTGSQTILDAYKELDTCTDFTMFKSIGFEDFLVLLQHTEFILGNSSAGVREAPYFGVPTIDIGSRQHGRYSAENTSIVHVDCEQDIIVSAIQSLPDRYKVSHSWGTGNSSELFMELLEQPEFWSTSLQKR